MIQKPRFIFTLTTGHSGGTLLNLLLGTSPAVLAAGESLRMPKRLTGGKRSEATKTFWSVALDQLAAQGLSISDPTKAFSDLAPTSFWQSWTEIVASMSPEPVVADKSLSLPIIRKICDAGYVDPFFIHLIRDPRAVCYSFIKKSDIGWRRARSWNRSHKAIEAFLGTRSNVSRVRYEDLATNPSQQIRQILTDAGSYYDLDLVTGTPEDVGQHSLDDPIFENCIFAGNRMYTDENRKGAHIEADMAFLTELSSFDWAITNAFCWRRMVRYGYSAAHPKV